MVLEKNKSIFATNNVKIFWLSSVQRTGMPEVLRSQARSASTQAALVTTCGISFVDTNVKLQLDLTHTHIHNEVQPTPLWLRTGAHRAASCAVSRPLGHKERRPPPFFFAACGLRLFRL